VLVLSAVAMDLREVLSNPVAVLVLLPFLPLVVVALALQSLLGRGETTNVEEWEVWEENGKMIIRVHRHVRRE